MVKIINLKEYQKWLEKRNLSFETIRSYSWVLREYGTRELNTDSIVVFLKERLTRYEPKSLRSLWNGLVSYAKFEKIEIERELITRVIPAIQQKFFPTINESELERLKQIQTKTITNQRNNLILDFLFWTGIRVKELINIRHCDYQNGGLQIHGKCNKIRYIPVPDFLVKYFNSSSDYLFKTWKGQKISYTQLWKIICCRAKKAGLEKNITPHSFRRSFATLSNNKGVKLTAIQKVLGHSDITTTANYIHNSYEELYQEYSKLWKTPLNSTAPPPPPVSYLLKK